MNNRATPPPKPKWYEPILPKRKEWPVVQLSRQRKQFVDTVVQNSVNKLREIAPTVDLLVDELETTLYKEKYRIKENPWAVDPDDDYAFWSSVKKQLVEISNLQTDDLDSDANQKAHSLLEEIITRYANEIASNFRPSYHHFARNVVTFGFSRLLNASRVKGFGSLFSNQYSLQDKIKITGEIEHLRSLAQQGTIVMVPTHFSNLDSILIGWVISELGLPPFIYGAGLNLFNIGIFAYFMNSLGAYKVDRRKKNALYIETLKAYSSLAMQWGIDSLFFPGGTRSRSGRIENKLKLGLLGTAMEAQRINYIRSQKTGEPAEKIFVFPVVLNYHFVLEAPSLIRDHLQREGQERYYIETDEYSQSAKIVKFLLKFFRKGSDISVSIGRGMDLLGNFVDDNGHSLDKLDRPISMREYFCTGDQITRDEQRESEYTQMLGEAILREYYRINQVFSSHLVAFVAFELIKKNHPSLDLFNLLRLPDEDLIIPYNLFQKYCEQVRQQIFELHRQGKVDIEAQLNQPISEVIDHGLSNVGMYHAKRPLLRNKAGDIETPDINTLYYYHNRLLGYNLHRIIHHSEKVFASATE
ncbi:1-acyl-sn-glycerol-3-phosphate acyltransferase [Tunicatimonas pelagia]|uniref:1-acyl-sn-glycerol-3-phosphate acyltransferase n=1 Tax=Tunicatimonas pelagia TaxID=931531 RepID=UPI0026659DF2|nr:1-acyl-sn-glycerol-3-phosphate acyltransferase [Tunicatimonas pelagia]WKN41413.1 1-acyl-sn-glycerol-3-phosphate acyltransferase [Tunicatimonas pelagia]